MPNPDADGDLTECARCHQRSARHFSAPGTPAYEVRCSSCGHVGGGISSSVNPQAMLVAGMEAEVIRVWIVFAGTSPTMPEMLAARQLFPELGRMPVTALMHVKGKGPRWDAGEFRRSDYLYRLTGGAAKLGLRLEIDDPWQDRSNRGLLENSSRKPAADLREDYPDPKQAALMERLITLIRRIAPVPLPERSAVALMELMERTWRWSDGLVMNDDSVWEPALQVWKADAAHVIASLGNGVRDDVIWWKVTGPHHDKADPAYEAEIARLKAVILATGEVADIGP